MRSDSDLHETRTNAEQSETAAEFRVSYESRKAMAHLQRAIDRGRKSSRVSSLYFIGGGDGPVKIGHTRDVSRRLATLQAGSPVKLAVLAVIARNGSQLEVVYHDRFKSHRLHGEWFERVPAILEEIERLNDAPTVEVRP